MIAKFEEVIGNPEETALLLGDHMIVNDLNLQVIEPNSSPRLTTEFSCSKDSDSWAVAGTVRIGISVKPLKPSAPSPDAQMRLSVGPAARGLLTTSRRMVNNLLRGPIAMMMLWMLLAVFAAGGVGGVVNALMTDNGFALPRFEQVTTGVNILRPGFVGNVIIGAVAALMILGSLRATSHLCRSWIR